MRKTSLLVLFVSFLLTGAFWIQIPIHEDYYLYDPEVQMILNEGLSMTRSLEVSATTDTTLDLEITSDTNEEFAVLIVYCAFESGEDPAEESGIAHLLLGDKGSFNFFVLYVKDPSIGDKINTTVAAYLIQPVNMKHFQFNTTLTDGFLRVEMEIFALDGRMDFHTKLLLSYTYYLTKMKTWVWLSPIILITVLLGVSVPYFVIKYKKSKSIV